MFLWSLMPGDWHLSEGWLAKGGDIWDRLTFLFPVGVINCCRTSVLTQCPKSILPGTFIAKMGTWLPPGSLKYTPGYSELNLSWFQKVWDTTLAEPDAFFFFWWYWVWKTPPHIEPRQEQNTKSQVRSGRRDWARRCSWIRVQTINQQGPRERTTQQLPSKVCKSLFPVALGSLT